MSTEQTVANEVVLLTIEEKLVVRELQVVLLSSKDFARAACDAISQNERKLVETLKQIAISKGLDIDLYAFNTDSLTFSPKK